MKLMKILTTIIGFSLLLAACGGSDGGGGSPVDNTRASGSYSYVMLIGGNAMTTQFGKVSFDGNGSLTYTEYSPGSGGGSADYTSREDDSIAFDDFVGTIRNGGSFIAATCTKSGQEMMMLLVKNSSGLTDVQTAYRLGQFRYDAQSSAEIVDVDMATPGAGFLQWTGVAPVGMGGGNNAYTFKITSGLVTLAQTTVPFNIDERFGAVSPDGQVMIIEDGTQTTETSLLGAVGLEFPLSGMTNADLDGIYIMHQFMDDNVSAGPSFLTARIRINAKGDGTGTYSLLSMSSGVASDSGSFSYTVNDDGSIDFDGGEKGFMLADGSVFVIVDTDEGDNSVDIKVAVKQ